MTNQVADKVTLINKKVFKILAKNKLTLCETMFFYLSFGSQLKTNLIKQGIPEEEFNKELKRLIEIIINH